MIFLIPSIRKKALFSSSGVAKKRIALSFALQNPNANIRLKYINSPKIIIIVSIIIF